jgi:hypothetical protein
MRIGPAAELDRSARYADERFVRRGSDEKESGEVASRAGPVAAFAAEIASLASRQACRRGRAESA